jgi:hypothetical protein
MPFHPVHHGVHGRPGFNVGLIRIIREIRGRKVFLSVPSFQFPIYLIAHESSVR